MRGRIGVALLLITLVSPAAPRAEEVALLEVVLNGRPTGQVGQFLDREGRLFARPEELQDLGFEVPSSAPRGEDGLVALDQLPGLRVRVDRRRQTLVATAEDTALRPAELSASRRVRLAPLSPVGWGAVLNYDALGTWSGGATFGGIGLEGRAFSPFGTLTASGVTRFAVAPGQDRFLRLDTTYTYTEPDEMRRWRLGDVVAGALPWTRAVRLGGVQVASDFALRPDLVPTALPAFSGSAAVPSTVDVVVSGIRAFSQRVQPGPFEVRNLPMVTGAGDAIITVTDTLGRQTVTVLPFYASSVLLRPGLASYSLEAGPVRRGFGLVSDDYSRWAALGTVRYGLTDWLTLEGHAEATEGLHLGGVGAVLRVGTLGVLDAAVSYSTGRGPPGDALAGPESGPLFSIGVRRTTRYLSLSAAASFASPGYRDVAAAFGSPVPRRTLRATLGLPLGPFGSLSLSYVSQRGGTIALRPGATLPPDFATGAGGVALFDGGRTDFSVVTASYSARIADGVSLYATAFADLERGGSNGLLVGFAIAFGRGITGSVSGSRDGGHDTLRLEAQRTAWSPGEAGFRVMDAEGRSSRRFAEVEYLGEWGRMTAGVDQSDGTATGRAGARGSVVVAGGGVFLADRVQDSFAVVRTGDVPNVPIRHENRPAGVTDSRGRLLVPSLRSFQNNRLSIDTDDLPLDVQARRTRVVVRPGDRAGVTVDFGVTSSNAALLRLENAEGRPLPVGSVLRLPGLEPLPVGYDGETFASGLRPENEGEVELPDGARCRVRFAFRAVPGDVPTIGPVPCR